MAEDRIQITWTNAVQDEPLDMTDMQGELESSGLGRIDSVPTAAGVQMFLVTSQKAAALDVLHRHGWDTIEGNRQRWGG